MSQQTEFKRIALMGRQIRDSLITDTLMELKTYLEAHDFQVVFEESCAKLTSKNVSIVKQTELEAASDLIIVVGGDGSMLHAARVACQQNVPVLGVNRGHLGFLTDIYPHENDKILQILSGSYIEEQRFLLSTQITHTDNSIISDTALNDVVLLPGNIAHMIEFDIYIDDQFVCNQRADGLITATPTGSTAYALSGGGPILHPELDAIVVVPMFPHTLSNRPIVVNGNSQITIKISDNNETSPFISADGQERIQALPGTSVKIKKHSQQLRLIHPIDYNYFETLRAKLHWQSNGYQ